jgi:selenocysteine-specific elongation factor
MSLADLVARSGLTEAEIESAARPRLELLPPPHSWVLPRQWFGRTLDRLKTVLEEYHRQNPLLPGVPREELRSRELPGAPAFLLDALLARTDELAAGGDTVRMASHRLRFKEDEEGALRKIEEAFRRADLAVPGLPEVLAQCGVEPSRARTLLQILLRDKRLIRVNEDLFYHAGAIARLRSLLAGRRGERFGVGQFKDWTGVSRKYAIPLLEFLDRERVTRRDGDSRVVL